MNHAEITEDIYRGNNVQTAEFSLLVSDEGIIWSPYTQA
jgi:hypothetical protein